MNDLSVADVDADMAFMPYSQSRNFREGVNGTFFQCVFVHRIRINIRHTIDSISNIMRIRIKPTISLDEADAVSGSGPKPMRFNELRIRTDLIGVLFQLGFVSAFCQHLTIGSPNVSPAFFLGILRPGHEVEVVLGIGIHITGSGDIDRSDGTHHMGEVFCTDLCSECRIHSGNELTVRLPFRKASNQLVHEFCFLSNVRKRKHIKHLRLLYPLRIEACCGHCVVNGIHGIFHSLQPVFFFCGQILHHDLLEAGFVKLDVAIQDTDDCHYRQADENNDSEKDAAHGFQSLFVRQDGNGYLLQGSAYRYAHQRPPALPNMAALYSGAITCSKYRSFPQRYRQVPLSGYLMRSNSDGSTCKASIYSLGLHCPALKRN